MSLENNTTGLEEILASVNALPEAGSGGGVEELSTTITDNGMFEPGKNEYILDVPGLNVSTRTFVIISCHVLYIHTNNQEYHSYFVMVLFQRNNLTDSFTDFMGELEAIGATSTIVLNENSITLYGSNLDENTDYEKKHIPYMLVKEVFNDTLLHHSR